MSPGTAGEEIHSTGGSLVFQANGSISLTGDSPHVLTTLGIVI
jgi:hypothetical protein